MVILYKREDGTNACACDRAEALTPLFDNCDT